MRTSEYNQHKSQLGQSARKQTGSLAVRDLGSLVKQEHVVTTENLITLFVVVPRHVKKEWLSGYETLTDYIVSLLITFGQPKTSESSSLCRQGLQYLITVSS